MIKIKCPKCGYIGVPKIITQKEGISTPVTITYEVCRNCGYKEILKIK